MEYVACRKRKYNKIPVAVCLKKCPEEDRAKCKAFNKVDREVIKQMMEEAGMETKKEDVLEGCIEKDEKEEKGSEGTTKPSSSESVKAQKEVTVGDEVITIGEIKRLHKRVEANMTQAVATAKGVVEDSIRIGKLLNEAKAKVKHGEWLPWIEGNMPFSQQTASRYMKLFENRDQITHTLETVSNLSKGGTSLSIRGALRLLTPPGDESEEKELEPGREEKAPEEGKKPKKEKAKHVKAEVVEEEPEPGLPDQEELLEKVTELVEENVMLKQELLKREPAKVQKPEPKVPEAEKDPEKAGEKPMFCQLGELRFGLYQDQYNDVMEALERAKLIAESDKMGHCLSMICVEFNVLYPGVSPEQNDEESNMLRVKSAVEVVKRVEAMYRVKIPKMIDEKSGESYE